MKNIGKIIFLTAVFIIAFSMFNEITAQCPMCRMSAESNLKSGGTMGRGLNTGILYMLALPYLLVATMGYWWWRNRRKQEENPAETFLPNPETE